MACKRSIGRRIGTQASRSALAGLIALTVLTTACGSGPPGGPASATPPAPQAMTGKLAASPTPTPASSPSAPAATPASQRPAATSDLTRPGDAQGPYPITKVVDGDTDWVRVGGRRVKLRLIGIDTPETKDPRKPVQCFGEQASARAEQLLTDRNVWLEYDPSQGRRDRYGRDLVYIWLDAHTMFNEVMLREGFAHEYTYNRPYRYQQQFRAAETAARTAGLGLWSPQTCGSGTDQPAGISSTQPAAATTPSTPAQALRSSGQPYYSSCAEARAAGKAPLMRGQPGYRAGLDGDHDGVACE